MPRRSTVLENPHIGTILALYQGGRSIQSLADEFGLDYQALGRFLRKAAPSDVPDEPVKAEKKKAAPIFDDPAETFANAFGFDPMPHQVEYLASEGDLVVVKGRQIGMTQAAAALAIHIARGSYGPDVVIVSVTQRQSSETALRARNGLWQLGENLRRDAATVLELENGSRIVSLAGTPRAPRGYSARLLVVDEAGWVDEPTWAAARPMTSATGGRTIVQSTPNMPDGWFYDLWCSGVWPRMQIPSTGILPESKLAAERASMSATRFAQEYLGDFDAVGKSSFLWSEEDWARLIVPSE